jgi:hypothetical protein
VLLTTLTHSDTGLMRPVFGLRDVLSADDETVSLTTIQAYRLMMRFSLVRLDTLPQKQPSALARAELSK